MGLVEIEDRGAVRHVVMTRAEKRNAMNGEMVLALGDAFREAAMDDSVRVVVVRGDGGSQHRNPEPCLDSPAPRRSCAHVTPRGIHC